MAARDLLHLDYLTLYGNAPRPCDRMSESRLQEFYDRIRADLDRTVKFWRQHSRDPECGYGAGPLGGEVLFWFFYSSVQNTILFVECLLQWFFQLSQQRWKSVR